MKKKLMGMFMAATLVLAGVGGVAGHALSPETEVSGVVTDGGNPVAGASVTVLCGATTLTDTTDATGTYLVSFTAAQCPTGSIVTVTAQKGSKSGSKQGQIIGLTNKLNVGLVNVSIPEFGAIGGMLALGLGVGAIMYTRRRYAQGTSL
jgi:hypothetical protein